MKVAGETFSYKRLIGTDTYFYWYHFCKMTGEGQTSSVIRYFLKENPKKTQRSRGVSYLDNWGFSYYYR